MEHNAQNFMYWLKHGTGPYKAKLRSWLYCATKVPYTDTCDLLFGNYTSIAIGLTEMDSMKPLGFFHRADDKVWMYADLSNWFWDRKKPAAYECDEVIAEMKVSYQRELIQQLKDGTEWLLREYGGTLAERISEYKKYSLSRDVQIAYVSDSMKPLVTTQDVKFTVQEIIEYLDDPNHFFKHYARDKIKKDAEMYAYILMKNELILEELGKLTSNPPRRLYLYKQIRDILKDSEAVKVNLKLQNTRREHIEFKYPVIAMCRTSGDWIYSGYELTGAERKKLKAFKLVNGDLPWFEKDNIVPEDIVSITYKKRVLYERGD